MLGQRQKANPEETRAPCIAKTAARGVFAELTTRSVRTQPLTT